MKRGSQFTECKETGRSRHRRLVWLFGAALAGVALSIGLHVVHAPSDMLGRASSSPACDGCTDTAAVEAAHHRQDGGADHGRGLGSTTTGPLSALRQFLSGLFESSRHASDPQRLPDADPGSDCVHGDPKSCGYRLAGAGETHTGLRARWARQPASAAGSWIKGRVMAADGLGLEGITVTLATVRTFGAEDPGARHRTVGPAITVTDSSGGYEFGGLVDGDYEIRTAAHGPYRPTRIAARSGIENADIVLAAQVERVIKGRVTGIDGAPLESVSVLPLVTGVPAVRTDAFGTYRLPVSLGTGARNVKVRFQLPGFLDHEASVPMSAGASQRETSLDARMQPVEYWTRVSGVVTSTEGPPLAGRTVELRQIGGQRSYRATTDRRGRYAFDTVEAPVSYNLSVTGGPDHEDVRRRIDVTKGAAEVDVAVEPFEFGSVRGRLTNAEGAPVGDFSLVLRNTASAKPTAVVSSDPEGRFEIPLAPAGDLVLASQSSPSILIRGLRLAPGEQLDVPLVLDWGTHELGGVVLDHNDNPVPGARVLLSWLHRQGELTATTMRRARSDAQGAFSFRDLGPGPHLLEIDLPGRRPVKLTHDVTRQGYFVRVQL